MVDEKALQEENERLKNYIEILENQVKASEITISDMQNSLSWKVTKPVRFLKAHCLPVGAAVDFLKDMKKQGFRQTIRENRLKKYHKKYRYSDEILPSEYKNQVEQMSSCTTAYSVFIRLQEENEAAFTRMINQIKKQTLVPKCIFIYGDKRKDNMAPDDSLPVFFVEEGELTAIAGKLKNIDQVICIDGFAFLSQNFLFEFEMERKKTNGDIVYCDDGIEYVSGEYDYRYKPDYAPHYLEVENYIGNVIGIKCNLFQTIIRENTEYFEKNRSFIYSILLNGSFQIQHIPELLYATLPVSEGRLKQEMAVRTLYWKAKGDNYLVEQGLYEGTSHIKRNSDETPLISILIPTCDHIDDLDKCITSIITKSTYQNYEIVVIENNSKENETFNYYKQLESNERIRVVTWQREFNYAAINNFGLHYTKGEYIVFLNNDMEVITPDWMEEMLFYASRREVGAVGAKLFFPDDTIQHAGVILGIRRLAGHGHRNFEGDADGYMHRLKTVQDYSIVTAACLMVARNKIDECFGFDENLAVDYNDVDFCMKLREKGYYNVFTPYARLYHYESKSRGENTSPEKIERNAREFFYFTTKWYHSIMAGDPFYNKHLTLEDDSFAIK